MVVLSVNVTTLIRLRPDDWDVCSIHHPYHLWSVLPLVLVKLSGVCHFFREGPGPSYVVFRVLIEVVGDVTYGTRHTRLRDVLGVPGRGVDPPSREIPQSKAELK